MLRVAPNTMPVWYIILFSFIALAVGVSIDKLLTACWLKGVVRVCL